MINSKALKDFKLREGWLWSIRDFFWDIYWNLTKPYRVLKKLYEWQTNIFKEDYDFDFCSIYKVLRYKLQRIEKVLKNGHAIQEERDMKALALAIKLLGRLIEEDYSAIGRRRHERKWGESLHWTEKIPNEPLYSFKSYRTNMLPEQRDQEREEYRQNILHSEDRRRERDKKNLYAILAKYGESWWD